MAPDSSETLKAINDFYFNAWSMLMNALGALLVIGAGAVPLFTLWLQRKALKFQEQSFTTVIQAEFEKEKELLLEAVKREMSGSEERFKIKFELLEEELNQKAEKLECGIFLVQCRSHLGTGHIANAIYDACRGAEAGIKCKRENLVQTCLRLLMESLERATPADLKEIPDEKSRPSTFIELLEKNNENGRYSYNILKIKEQLKKLDG